jgi:thymidylate synthase
MDKTNEFTFIKQRKTHISKSVESFQNLMSSSNASDLTDLNRLIFDQNDTKKLIDKHQQTNSSNNYSLTIENICWFVLSIVSIYLSDILRVLMYDSRINR